MKLDDVASRFDVHPTTISKYELGQRSLTPELINKFCDLYGVTADYLLGRSINPRPVITDEDAALLAAYHAAPPSVAAAIKTLLQPYQQESAAAEEPA